MTAGPGAPGVPPVRVAIVDDDELVRVGLRAILSTAADLVVVSEAADGAEVVPLVTRTGPDVLLMDVRMPAIDGLQATRLVPATVSRPPRILVVTTFENDEYVYEALRSGASGFLLKRARPAEVLQAVRLVSTGESRRIDYGQLFTWSLANQMICLVGRFLLARAVLAWQRRGRGACLACGRPRTTDPRRALRTGRWAVGVAIAVPLVYTVIRYAWVLDIPLLIRRDNLRRLRDEGHQWVGAGLGTFATVGAVLTLGLVQRWGEVFPRWMPRVHGRPVPVRLGVVPASFVTVIVLAGTLGPALSGDLWREPEALPVALMPLWGVALGIATWAYRVRRQIPCTTCGRGT